MQSFGIAALLLQRKGMNMIRSRKYKEPYSNKPLRQAMEAAGCFYYELANLYGICPSTLTRWLRYRMSDERISDLLALLRAYAEGHGRDSREVGRAYGFMLAAEEDLAAEEG